MAAVMVTVCGLLTALVLTVKVAVVEPAGTETVDGACADEPLTDRLTVTGAFADACPIVTVPVLDDPPHTDVGLSERLLTVNGVTARTAVLFTPLKVAVIVTFCAVVTASVVTTKVAVVAPPATVTEDGTVAAAVLELVNVITSPAETAAPPRVTVPVIFVWEPPTHEVGDTETLSSGGAWTVRVAVFEVEFKVAVMVAAVVVATAVEVTEKVAEVAPDGTVTD